MSAQNHVFEVVLTNLTPYHSSKPGNVYVNLEGRFVSGKGKDIFPCVLTRQMPVIAPASGDDVPHRAWVPIMPANSLRHELREGILEPIMEAFRGKHTLSVGAYAAAWSGNASGNPDGTPAPFEEVLNMGKHPFIGLFGGGPRMLEGKLMVDAAWAITPASLPMIGDGYENEVAPMEGITEVVFKRRVDPITQLDEDKVALIENPVESVTEWFNEYYTRTDASNQEDEEGENSRGLKAFNAHQVVIPGVHWAWRIETRRGLTEAQIGAILTGLQALHGRHIGGMSSIGYGKIKVRSIRMDGREVWSGVDYLDDESIHRYFEAWGEALENIKPADFEAFAS